MEEENVESTNVVEQNIEKFKEVVDSTVPVLKEINDIKRDINKEINACAKYGLDRPAKELNYTARLLHDFESAMDVEDSKLYKLVHNLKTVTEYLDAMGKKDIVQRLGNDLGMNLDLKFSAEYSLGEDRIVDTDKATDAYTCLFNDEIPDDRCEMVTKLIDLAIDTHGEVVDKMDDIKDELTAPLEDTGIKATVAIRGAKLKIRQESAGSDDVTDKINAITESALLESEALQSIIE